MTVSVVVAAAAVAVDADVGNYCGVPYAAHLASNSQHRLGGHVQLPSTGSDRWKASESVVLAAAVSLFPEN